MNIIVVVEAISGSPLPGIPTPTLIEAGGGEAYFVPNTGPSAGRLPGVWYLRAPGYESPDGTYRHVQIVTEA